MSLGRIPTLCATQGWSLLENTTSGPPSSSQLCSEVRGAGMGLGTSRYTYPVQYADEETDSQEGN